MSLFWYALLCFALIVFRYLVVVNVLWLFLAVPWVVQQCVVVVFPDHTRLFFCFSINQLSMFVKPNLKLFKIHRTVVKLNDDSHNYHF